MHRGSNPGASARLGLARLSAGQPRRDWPAGGHMPGSAASPSCFLSHTHTHKHGDPRHRSPLHRPPLAQCSFYLCLKPGEKGRRREGGDRERDTPEGGVHFRAGEGSAKRARKEGQPRKEEGRLGAIATLPALRRDILQAAGRGGAFTLPGDPPEQPGSSTAAAKAAPEFLNLAWGSPSISGGYSGLSPGRRRCNRSRRRRFFRFCCYAAAAAGLVSCWRSLSGCGRAAAPRALGEGRPGGGLGEGGHCCGEGSGGEAGRHSSPRGRRVTGSRPAPLFRVAVGAF